MSQVMIDIAAEFTGRKGFKEAETATMKLEKSVSKLGKQLLGVFSVAKVTQYSKQSILAYTEDRRAAALLGAQLKNLGLAYAEVDVEKFIASMEKQTGILDDELRPAFSQLARVTGSVAKSQELMATAFDTSRGAGVSFQQAVDAISQAYVGNTRGLRALNIGLTQAELNTKNFDEIVGILNKKFKGAGAASVDTYAGKIDLLKVSMANAQETIGKGFIDAFQMLADDKNFNDVISGIDKAATGVADLVRGVGVVLKSIDANIPSWFKTLISKNFEYGVIGRLMSLGKANRPTDFMSGVGTSYQSIKANEKLTAAAQAKALAAEKKRLDLLKKQTAEKKAQTAIDNANKVLATAKGMFDTEGIQIAAALQGKVTDEQKARLELMQKIWQLEQAIASENTNLIVQLTGQLAAMTKQTEALNNNYQALGKIADALNKLGYDRNLFNLDNLTASLALIQQIGGASHTPATFAASGIPSNLYPALLMDLPNAAAESVVVPEVNISIEGSVSDLINVVVDGLQQQSASGISTRIARNTGGFNW